MSENANVQFDNGTIRLTLFVEPDACDMTMHWRASASLTAMQLATHYARESLGIDWEKVRVKDALWVVSRVNVNFYRIPMMGEKLVLEAIPLQPVKALYPWQFNFIDSNGVVVGNGSSLWNLMDAATRHIAIRSEISAKIPSTGQAGKANKLPDPARELSSPAKSHSQSPLYTDLDINGHTSHIRYIDWCCNALGPSVMSRFGMNCFRISYMKEICAGQTAETELRLDGSEFSFSGYIEDALAFVVDGNLSPHEQH